MTCYDIFVIDLFYFFFINCKCLDKFLSDYIEEVTCVAHRDQRSMRGIWNCHTFASAIELWKANAHRRQTYRLGLLAFHISILIWK
jgi:hypothetical protein